MSKTAKWAFALLLAACVYAPATALAEPVPSDLPQTDAASETDERPTESDGATIDSDTAAAPAPSDFPQEGIAPDVGTESDDGSAAAADDAIALQGEEGSDTDALAASRAEEEQEPAKSAEPKAAVPSPTKAPAKAQRAPAARGPIYVNGSTGNDANAGTETAPVKTFAKAKELLEASGGEAIYVSGALQASGDAGTWELGGKTLARGDGYQGELIRVIQNAVLTLKNIILDGRSGDGQTGVAAGGGEGGGGSLVGVYGGTLTVGEGAILQNNNIKSEGRWYPEAGGAILANKGVVNIEGGTIRNNEAVRGGGIYGCYNAVINMSSGTITGNRAVESASTAIDSRAGGSGGGICVFDGADINFSGGTISGNTAFERGGGISVGTFYGSNSQSVLVMTGGTIDGNNAGSGGGGIFVQYGSNSAYSVAYITGGNITNNAMTGEGDDSGMFGGGGIYVNGIGDGYDGWHDAELYLSNVEVSGNSASIYGGGYAACPASLTEINLTNGSVFYGNTATEGADELYILAATWLGAHSGNPSYEISPSMLGGGAYKWVYDDGTEVPLDQLKGILSAFWGQELSLGNALTADDPGVQKALGLAKVHITGNTSATRGGGIGSNGSVFIGKSVETIEIPISKLWNDGNDKDGLRPSSVKVNLYRDGQYVGYQTMEPNTDGTWSMTFENLPKNDANGHEYTYTVEERAVGGYTGAIVGDAASGFSITNTVTVSVSGNKVWNDADDQDGIRPDSITVNLMRNGEKLDSKPVTAKDNWAFLFDELAKYDADGNEYVYTVAEDAVEGYEPAITGAVKTGFTITNSHTPETISISVIKNWVGGEGSTVTIHLFADGVDTGKTLSLDGTSAWKGSFTDLPKYRSGEQISYTIAEDAVEGYVSTITGDAASGFTVTNTKEGTPPGPHEPTPKGGTPPAPSGLGVAGFLPATGDSPAAPIALLAAAFAFAAAVLAARRRTS